MIHLRPATQDDFSAIRSLIRLVRINPISLDWRRFWVAVTSEGEVIGCGQIKSHRDGSNELASIAVHPAWRGKGIARAIIAKLIGIHNGRLYLTCRAEMGEFYEKFGFNAVSQTEMPRYFQRLAKLAKAFIKLHLIGGELLVMMRDCSNVTPSVTRNP